MSKLGVLVVLGALALAQPVHATTIQELGLTELFERSELVFEGDVLQVQTQKAQQLPHMFTVITVRLETLFKGEATGQVVLRLPGGAQDGQEVLIPGVPSFSVGQRILIFAERTAPSPSLQGLYLPLGLGAGSFVLENNEFIRKDEGLHYVNPKDWCTGGEGLHRFEAKSFREQLRTLQTTHKD